MAKYIFPRYKTVSRVAISTGYDTVIIKNGEADLDPETHQEIIKQHGGMPAPKASKAAKKDK